MAESVDAESGISVEKVSNGQHSQSGEALVEWRSSDQVENGTPSTSPIYWDTDDDEDEDENGFGPKPSELYGKHTWKIDNFSEINKRELRSSAFEVGGYQWYILIYPQGCDVCNHLSLFLCVANHDKLLPGWSHFAQFTIAVVNKDPKKSKYSDTLHRFWKKEHDWGWKKFMELPKLKDGFIDDSDSLIIKAQVQVIRERADQPFRCLDSQYRRELVRVYLTNVEQICRRFVEERRSKLGRLLEDKARWSSFCTFWLGMDQNSRRKMSREKMDVILKVAVKHFFIEKEVTSTLVMDSLYSGLKALEGHSKNKKSGAKLSEGEDMSAPIVGVDKDMFVLVDDVILLLQRAATEPLPPKDDKGPQNRTKDGNAGEDFKKEMILRDERHLTELGRRTVEIFVLAHIFSNKIEVAYQEAIALKRQEELIREEEAAWLAESELKAKRGAEKEKKSKKKQAKQKRNKSKAKEKRDEKVISGKQDRHNEENHCNDNKGTVVEKAEDVHDNFETLEDVLSVSDSLDGSTEILPDSEDRDSSPVNWDTDTSEVHHHSTEGCSSGTNGLLSVLNDGPGKKSSSVMDDSSSTCSNDSVPPVVNNGSYKGNSSYHYNPKSPTIGKNGRSKGTCDASSEASETAHQISSLTLRADESNRSNVSESSKSSQPELVVVKSSQDPKNLPQHHSVKKAGNSIQKKQDTENSNSEQLKEKTNRVPSFSRSPPKHISCVVQAKSDSRTVPNASDPISKRKTSLNIPGSSDQAPSSTAGAPLQSVALKPTEKLPTPPMPVVSRPSSAPLIHSSRSAVPAVSVVQTTSLLPRSISSTGRSGPDPAPPTQNYVPQSYRNALSNPVGSSGFTYPSPPSQLAARQPLPISSSFQPSLPIGVSNQDVLPGGAQWTGNWGSRSDTCISLNHVIRNANQLHSTGSCDRMGFGDIQAQGLLTDEFPHLDIINDLLEDEHASSSVMPGDLFHVPQLSSNSYATFPGTDRVMSSGDLSSMFDRSMGYHNDRIQQGYGHYESLVELGQQASSLAYANGISEGFIPSQWPTAPLNLSMLASMRNSDIDGYPYFESLNPNPSGSINGYTDFRRSSGH